jgi:hypothetical protein
MQLKMEMQQKIEKMESQMKELGQQVAIQTYQALVNEESPLATKTDHANLQHDMTRISMQLSTLITMFQTAPPSQHNLAQISCDLNALANPNASSSSSPPRNTKRSKPNLTPVKMNMLEEVFTQDCSVSSASSTPDEGMEGCEN